MVKQCSIVCVCVCIHTNTYIYIQIHIYIHMFIYMYLYMDGCWIQDTCTPKFIAPLFTTARTWKQPKCPPTDKWINTTEHYSMCHCIYIPTYIYIYVCVCVCVYILVNSVPLCVCVYIYIHTQTYVCICVYINISICTMEHYFLSTYIYHSFFIHLYVDGHVVFLSRLL